VLNINYRAVLFGFSAYVLIWVLWSFLASFASDKSEITIYLISVLTNFAGLVPGYIAARFAKERQLFYGLLTGIVVGIGILIFWYAIGALENSYWYSYMLLPTNTAIMSLLGGIVSKFYFERDKKDAL
jgi:putative membrane protein (TIGR04086 family)